MKRALTVLAVCAVLAAVLPGSPLLAQMPRPAAAPGQGRHEIVVSGRGSVSAVPDRITITVVTDAMGSTLPEAQQQRDAAVASIVRDVVALGVSQQSIETTTFAHPLRGGGPSRRGGSPGTQASGYAAIGRIVVTANSPALATRVVNAATAAGTARIARVRAGLRDPSPYHTQALKLAVERAQTDAMTIAAAAGVSTPHLAQMQELPALPLGHASAHRGLGGTSRPSHQMWGANGSKPGGHHRMATIPQTVPVIVTVRGVYTF